MAADLGFPVGKNYFDNDGMQNYLTFQPINNTFTQPTGDTETMIVYNPKDFQMQSLGLLLYQVIVF